MASFMVQDEMDTVYISLEHNSDSFRLPGKLRGYKNEVDGGGRLSPNMYRIYGFIRDNKPKDFLDSAGYNGFSIDLEKDTLAICRATECRAYICNRMITLYDLKDSLKAHMDYAKARKRDVFDRFSPNSFLARKNLVLILVEEDKHQNYYMRKVENIYYFDPPGH
jgi:hypothetical protein